MPTLVALGACLAFRDFVESASQARQIHGRATGCSPTNGCTHENVQTVHLGGPKTTTTAAAEATAGTLLPRAQSVSVPPRHSDANQSHNCHYCCRQIQTCRHGTLGMALFALLMSPRTRARECWEGTASACVVENGGERQYILPALTPALLPAWCLVPMLSLSPLPFPLAGSARVSEDEAPAKARGDSSRATVT